MAVTGSPFNPARIYDDVRVPAMFALRADDLLARVAIRHGNRVLDVACGTGAVTHKLSPLVGATGEMVGLDIATPNA